MQKQVKDTWLWNEDKNYLSNIKINSNFNHKYRNPTSARHGPTNLDIYIYIHVYIYMAGFMRNQPVFVQ